MVREKRGSKNIKETPASKLLDDFVVTDTVHREETNTEMSDEEYIEMMIKKEAERKLLRIRRDVSISDKVEIFIDDKEDVPERKGS
ncbi:MAG: hypothetical protein ACFFE6_12770 [Candidatus Thorarchaeota archaeon]